MTIEELDELERRFWLGNRMPSNLWKEHRRRFEDIGVTWSRFLWLLKICSGDVVLFMMDELDEESLISNVLAFAVALKS